MVSATAPGKAILFGEHAVVYGRPAIAIPLEAVRSVASVEPGTDDVVIDAADLGQRYRLRDAPAGDPLAAVIHETLKRFDTPGQPCFTVTIFSTVPTGRGLGSSASVATAIVRALAAFFGRPVAPGEVSEIVFRSEVLLHGTPSGIDNTVVAYEQPVYFVRGRPIERFAVGAPLRLLVADTGVFASTREVVGDLRRRWEQAPSRYNAWFGQIGEIVQQARDAIAAGHPPQVGALMNRNQVLLRTLDVSSKELDRLVEVALNTGALGAKLSGAGRGGNMIALVSAERQEAVAQALRQAGAVSVIETELS